MRFRFWKIASAEPRYQSLPARIWAGTLSQYCPRNELIRHARERWLLSESDLYWVSTFSLKTFELTKFDRQKSMIRYRPPNGTAGFARSRVRGSSRVPAPPARIIASEL